MTILTPEVRALLKRMDADDAIDKAVELALEAAATECERMMMYQGGRQESAVYDNVWEAARGIRALKDQK